MKVYVPSRFLRKASVTSVKFDTILTFFVGPNLQINGGIGVKYEIGVGR